MSSKIFWTFQHMKRAMHDMRFTAACWWLSQRVDFLAWRRRFDSHASAVPDDGESPVRSFGSSRRGSLAHAVTC